MQWNTQFFIGGQQLRIDFVQTLWFVRHAFRRRVIRQRLKIRFWISHMGPVRLRHFLPRTEGFQTPFGQPLWLAFLGRNKAHNVFIKACFQGVRFDVGKKTGFVFFANSGFDLGVIAHCDSLIYDARRWLRCAGSLCCMPGTFSETIRDVAVNRGSTGVRCRRLAAGLMRGLAKPELLRI